MLRQVTFCDWRWKEIGQWEMATKFGWSPGKSQAIHSGSARNDWCPYLLEVNDSNAYHIVTNESILGVWSCAIHI
jgi:hypothetical protein